MVQFCVDIAEGSPCGVCNETIPLQVDECPKCSTPIHRLTFTEFIRQLEHRRITDARHGGLVVGRHGSADDIPMYIFLGGGIFELTGLMHGGEFIVSREATAKHLPTLETINSEKGVAAAEDVPLRYSPIASVINTNLMPAGGALWIDPGQFIINGFATAKHLETLEKLNADGNPESLSSIAIGTMV